MYVYIQSERRLWTVGHYAPNGKWEPESDHDDPQAAANRAARLNGEIDEPLAQENDQLKAQLAEASCLLEQAHDRINLLESARNDSIEYNATLVNTLALRDRHVAELEAQLAAVLRTIEAATRASQ